MKKIKFFIIILLLPFSCSLPKIHSPDSHARQERCNVPYLSGKWQFIHSIEAEMPGGRKGTLIGVTVISTEKGIIHSAIMTIEGLVLFDAQYDKTLVVNRGVPPFDSPAFAKGQIDDIKLIFFRPDGELIESGMLENGLYVCRYKNDNGVAVDVITGKDEAWRINQYNRNARLKRTIKAFFNEESVSVNGHNIRSQSKHESQATSNQQPATSNFHINQNPIPHRLELSAYGFARYALKLELIEAELLTD